MIQIQNIFYVKWVYGWTCKLLLDVMPYWTVNCKTNAFVCKLM